MKAYSRSYSELILLKTFEERFEYLRLDGVVGIETFGYDRYLNQLLYRSSEWKKIRNEIIVRDNGCDLGIDGHEIFVSPLIHHINPITIDDVKNRNPIIFDSENLITTILSTHNAIHYGYEVPNNKIPNRIPNDTCPWKQ
jgi:hypothetical protein